MSMYSRKILMNWISMSAFFKSGKAAFDLLDRVEATVVLDYLEGSEV